MEAYRSIYLDFEDIMPIKFYGTSEEAHALSFK
jgi:hypothetical protein